jgi:hypothetical protein
MLRFEIKNSNDFAQIVRQESIQKISKIKHHNLKLIKIDMSC